MALALITRAIHAVEEAQQGLALQHTNLTVQAEYLKNTIREAQER